MLCFFNAPFPDGRNDIMQFILIEILFSHAIHVIEQLHVLDILICDSDEGRCQKMEVGYFDLCDEHFLVTASFFSIACK